MKRISAQKKLLLAAASVVSVGPGAYAAPTIDGTKDAEYRTAVAVQTVDTGFGDNQSELDAAYVRIAGGKLHLFLSGNLESNFNKMEIFFDTKAGGQNQILNNNPNVDFDAINQKLAGFKFDAGFAPDHTLFYSRNFTDIFVNYSQLNTTGGGSGSYLGSIGLPNPGQQGSGTLTNAGFPTVDLGYIDTNAAGVGGGSGAANQANALAVNTGNEIAIDPAAFDITGNFNMSAFINGSSHDFLSNQILGGFTAPQINPGGDGAGNYNGTVGGIDLNTFAGNQFFAVNLGAASNEWTDTGSGNWGDNAKWEATVGSPNASGDYAYFGGAISGNQTVTLEAAKTVGGIIFDNASNQYSVAASSTNPLTLDTPTSRVLVLVNSGNHSITGPVNVNKNTLFNVVSSGSSLTLDGLQATTSSITKAGAGTLVVNAVNAGGLTVNAGTLKISTQAPTPIAAGNTVGSLAVNTAGGAVLDITNNAIVVKSTDTTDTDRNAKWALVTSGQNNFDNNGQVTWDGPGVVSSTARASNVTLGVDVFVVGVVSNHDLARLSADGGAVLPYDGSNPWLGTISSVGADDILVRMTYAGDTNLDGQVTIDDYNNIDGTFSGLLATNYGWASGDFDFSGAITIDDYNAIDTGFLYQGGQLTESMIAARTAMFGADYVAHLEAVAAAFASVPEPTTLGVLAIGAMGLLSRRRRTA